MITFFHGVMGAGKSSAAIDYYYTHPKSLIISGGDRTPGRVTSRDGRSVASTELSYLHLNTNHVLYDSLTVVVDECQFLAPSDVHILYYISNYGLDVALFGLKTSYLNQTFPVINFILSVADAVYELGQEECWCGRPATTHGRIVGNTMIKTGNPCIKGDILGTFDEFYVVLCNDHWVSGQWCANIPVCTS